MELNGSRKGRSLPNLLWKRTPSVQSCFYAFIAALIILIIADFFDSHLLAAESTKKQICLEEDYYTTIHQLWEKRKPVYVQWMKASSGDPYNLYNIQTETNNLLKYAGLSRDTKLIEELIHLYSLGMDTLDETDKYVFYYHPGHRRQSIHKLEAKHRIWQDNNEPVGVESILVSSQFLYLLSEATAIVSLLSPDHQTATMHNTIREFVPVLLDHYRRWIVNQPGPFQVRGWGCKEDGQYVPSGMNHSDFLKGKLNSSLGDGDSPSYCNAVTDTDMWIIAGVVNLLAAHNHNDKVVHIPQSMYDKLQKYVTLGVNVLQDRFVYTTLLDFDGNAVRGALFEPGVWRDHPSYAYAGYSGGTFPITSDPNKKQRGKGVGWDLSHARRFVHVFDTLHQHRSVLNIQFPSKDFMKMLTNQFIYATFNRDFKRPLFSNFVDGSNGWYRVGYKGRVGFGYGPFDMSVSVLTGGYGFWSVYNRDVESVCLALLKMICSSDQDVRTHVKDHYEKNVWNKYFRPRRYDFSQMDDAGVQSLLIQFLPSLLVI